MTTVKTYRHYSFTFTSRAYYTWSSLHISFLASLIVNWTCISFRSKEKMLQWRRPKLMAKVSSVVQSVTESSLLKPGCVSTWSPIRLKRLYYTNLLRCQSRLRYLLTPWIIFIWICIISMNVLLLSFDICISHSHVKKKLWR